MGHQYNQAPVLKWYPVGEWKQVAQYESVTLAVDFDPKLKRWVFLVTRGVAVLAASRDSGYRRLNTAQVTAELKMFPLLGKEDPRKPENRHIAPKHFINKGGGRRVAV